MLRDKVFRKTLTFRFITLTTTLALTYMFTGNVVTSVGLTTVQQGLNTGIYYFFEKNYKDRGEANDVKRKSVKAVRKNVK